MTHIELDDDRIIVSGNVYEPTGDQFPVPKPGRQLATVTNHYYHEPTCPDCGHPLTGAGCEECGDSDTAADLYTFNRFEAC